MYIVYILDDLTLVDWIINSFLESNNSMILLLSKDTLFPQQTASETIDVTQLHLHIVKVLTRCVLVLNLKDQFDCSKLESLLKILLMCLRRVDLKNFHMLGK